MGADDTTQRLWRTDFDKQYTRDLVRDVLKRTTALVKRYGKAARNDTAEDRFHTALMKLLDGTRTWDPSRVDLTGFLYGVISSDLATEVKRAKKTPVVSLDEPRPTREDDYTGETCDDATTEGAHADGWNAPTSPATIDDAWVLAMNQLHARAGSDANVLALLAAHEEGAVEKRDVMRLLKWSSRKYNAAFERLLALAETLDEGVRETIVDAFTD